MPAASRDQRARVGLTLALGLVGAGGGVALGLPAGALVGSSIFVSAIAAAGARLEMAALPRNMGFAVIGLSLGAGISPDSFTRLESWGVSLLVLSASIATTTFGAAWVLRRAYDLDPQTAVLSASPGTMSYALAIAADGRGDVPTVLVLQVLRLLILAAVLPPLVVAFATAPVSRPVVEAMEYLPLCAVLVPVAALGWLGTRVGLPAAWLVAGMIANGAAHAAGLVEGAAPAWMLFAGFAVTGATLGSRFSGLTLATMRRLLGAALVTVAFATAISAAFAALTTTLTGLPFGQSWIAYAPGGVEAMAAIGLSLGYDTAFIALHHLVRIGLLIGLLPLALRVIGRTD